MPVVVVPDERWRRGISNCVKQYFRLPNRFLGFHSSLPGVDISILQFLGFLADQFHGS